MSRVRGWPGGTSRSLPYWAMFQPSINRTWVTEAGVGARDDAREDEGNGDRGIAGEEVDICALSVLSSTYVPASVYKSLVHGAKRDNSSRRHRTGEGAMFAIVKFEKVAAP